MLHSRVLHLSQLMLDKATKEGREIGGLEIHGMRLIVATLPDPQFQLGRDVSLTKAMALYGDETVLYSPTYHVVEPLLDFSSRGVLYNLIWLSLLARQPGSEIYKSLTRGRSKSLRGDFFLKRATRYGELVFRDAPLTVKEEKERDQIADEAVSMARRVEPVFSDDKDYVQRARTLKRAEDLGLLQIPKIGQGPSIFFDPGKLASDIRNALSSPDSYGAIDDRFVTKLRHPIKAHPRNQKIALVGSEIFRRLPTFDRASFEEGNVKSHV